MFERTKELENGVRVMNAVEDAKFPLILSRIAQFLSTEASPKPFTDAEERKLETSLEISGNEVQLLITTATEIFTKSAYFMIKPSALGEQLEKVLNLHKKKTEDFVQAWTTHAKGIVENFKQKSYLSQLSHMSYSLSIETASELETREKALKAQLQFGLTNDKKREDVNVEFTHDELYNFYQKLEQIQDQLDAIR